MGGIVEPDGEARFQLLIVFRKGRSAAPARIVFSMWVVLLSV